MCSANIKFAHDSYGAAAAVVLVLTPFVREILPGQLGRSGKGIKSRPKSLGTKALLLSPRNRRPRRGQERTLAKRSFLVVTSTENVKIRQDHPSALPSIWSLEASSRNLGTSLVESAVYSASTTFSAVKYIRSSIQPHSKKFKMGLLTLR